MFGYLKRGFVIEKAYDLWRREAGIDLKTEVASYPMARQTEFRNMLRESQKSMAATEHEVAILMMLPFLPNLDPNGLKITSNLVDQWALGKTVRATVSQQFRAMLPQEKLVKNRVTKVDFPPDTAAVDKFVMQLKYFAVRHFSEEELKSVDPSEYEKVHFWAGLACLAYMQDSVLTADDMGRPVKEPQDLVTAASVAFVVTHELRRLTNGKITEPVTNEMFVSLVGQMAGGVFGETFPGELIAQATAKGRSDGMNFVFNDELMPVGNAICDNFREYVASKVPKKADALGRLLAGLDKLPE